MKRTAVLAVLLLAPILAVAHAGEEHIMGVVKSISGSELTVETSSGVQTIQLSAQTKFVEDGAPSSRDKLRQGARVVVHAAKQGEAFVATQVQFSTQGKKQ